jgi:predicted transcriptional regulator
VKAADRQQNELITLTADIVSAHVANNAVHPSEVPTLIAAVHGALSQLGTPAPAPAPEKPQGAVSARASIKPGFLLSMIDGKPYKTLRRHIGQHGYTPDTYREAFGLPRDYPMVAADYAEQRRAMALKIGLGRKRATAEVASEQARRKPMDIGGALDAARAHLSEG